MNRSFFTSSLLLGMALVVVPPALEGQTDPPQPQPPTGGQAQQGQGQQTQDLTLVFDREVFVYPRLERRDPFLPLLDQSETGPRFEEIELIGVMLSPNPDLSVAVFGLRGGGGFQGGQQGQGTARAYRVRRGDQLGNVRILEILLTRVIVAVDEFGETQQHIMELQRPGQGGL